MGSRINLDASLWNLYCFTETWGYTFNPTTRKVKKKKPWCEWKEISFTWDLLIFSNRSISYEFGNLLNFFWGKDLGFLSLLIKLFEYFNLTNLRTSSHFKWEFIVNAKNVVAFLVVLCGANETSEFSFGEGSGNSILFLAQVKYRAEISLKIAKIG